MSNKILFCATVDYHFSAFHLPYMKWFKEQGWDVHVAAAGELQLPYVDKKYNIRIQRNPFHYKNVIAYKQLKTIIRENKYSIIHCHTPLGGALARLAARTYRKSGTKVLYTAHGFHFCKGAPLLNWLFYYPIERLLARYTDCLITINNEDYMRAINHRFQANRIAHVHGVGVNTNRFKPISAEEKCRLRKIYNYNCHHFLLFYAAELNKNKNQKQLIYMMKKVSTIIPEARLLLAGPGPKMSEYKQLTNKLGISHMVHFLGHRSDVDQLLPMCDVAVASSLREGLPVNIMEAMACGLPAVVTKNRGHSELIINSVNGYIVNPHDEQYFADKIIDIYLSKKRQKMFGVNSLKIVQKYSLTTVQKELCEIYAHYMMEDSDEAKSKYHCAYI